MVLYTLLLRFCNTFLQYGIRRFSDRRNQKFQENFDAEKDEAAKQVIFIILKQI